MKKGAGRPTQKKGQALTQPQTQSHIDVQMTDTFLTFSSSNTPSALFFMKFSDIISFYILAGLEPGIFLPQPL